MELYNDATGQMSYDREYLNKAIPAATIAREGQK
jgi:hypothetical protein